MKSGGFPVRNTGQPPHTKKKSAKEIVTHDSREIKGTGLGDPV